MTASEPSRPAPRPVWLIAAAALTALIGLGLLVHHLGDAGWIDEPTDFDRAVHAWVVRYRPGLPGLTAFFRLATRFGNPNPATFFTAVVTFTLYVLGKRGALGLTRGTPLVWLGAILGGRFLSVGLKLVYQRDRPPPPHRLVTESTYSFPSGHSVFAATFFTLLALLLARLIPPGRPWVRAAAVLTCLGAALVVGLSRVWLGVHYPTDVAGGLLLGAAWALTASAAARGWTGREPRASGRGR